MAVDARSMHRPGGASRERQRPSEATPVVSAEAGRAARGRRGHSFDSFPSFDVTSNGERVLQPRGLSEKGSAMRPFLGRGCVGRIRSAVPLTYARYPSQLGRLVVLCALALATDVRVTSKEGEEAKLWKLRSAQSCEPIRCDAGGALVPAAGRCRHG